VSSCFKEKKLTPQTFEETTHSGKSPGGNEKEVAETFPKLRKKTTLAGTRVTQQYTAGSSIKGADREQK
jgi:hypothetical protein